MKSFVKKDGSGTPREDGGRMPDLIHLVTPPTRDGEAPAKEGGANAGNKAVASAVMAQVQAAVAGGQVQTRAQALAQLRSVAEFFRRTEPHSPVAYLAEKAAKWGEQPSHEWLRGVVKDPAVFAQLAEMLGVQAISLYTTLTAQAA